jgi:hypothetical protein
MCISVSVCACSHDNALRPQLLRGMSGMHDLYMVRGMGMHLHDPLVQKHWDEVIRVHVDHGARTPVHAPRGPRCNERSESHTHRGTMVPLDVVPDVVHAISIPSLASSIDAGTDAMYDKA